MYSQPNGKALGSLWAQPLILGLFWDGQGWRGVALWGLQFMVLCVALHAVCIWLGED